MEIWDALSSGSMSSIMLTETLAFAMAAIFLCLGNSVECPIHAILEYILQKEVILSLSWVLSECYVIFIVLVGVIFWCTGK